MLWGGVPSTKASRGIITNKVSECLSSSVVIIDIISYHRVLIISSEMRYSKE